MSRNFALPGRSPVYASECAATTSHPLATATALRVLTEGGNAVDAAIAASVTLCVVEPHMTGIGGDCFSIVAEPNGKLHGLNASGRSAKGAELGWYLENGITEIIAETGHSVTAPGALRGWEALHNKFGQMDFVRLFADAIRYAEDGFAVAPRVARDWGNAAGKLAGNEGAAKHYLFDGKAPVAGQRVTAQALAKTLRRIATDGVSVFYEGEIAAEIASTVQANGGFLTEEDLAGTAADWVTPISTEYRGHMLHEIPPNGQGLTALVLMRLLDKIGIADASNAPERAHLEAECGRIAYAMRDAYISDPVTMDVSVEELLSETHINDLSKLFDPAKRNNDLPLPDPKGSDTVYLSVVDRDGMAVSFINSLFGDFGSGIVTSNSGVSLQNRACGFNVKEGHANAIGPSKRPFHTIIPAMVTKDGKPTHSFGVMGGQYQAMGQAHVLSNMLDYGMDPQAALDDYRIFWDADGVLGLETGVPDSVENYLKARGHACAREALHGGGQIIRIDQENGVLIAGSDPRKDGHAAGI